MEHQSSPSSSTAAAIPETTAETTDITTGIRITTRPPAKSKKAVDAIAKIPPYYPIKPILHEMNPDFNREKAFADYVVLHGRLRRADSSLAAV